jgi:dethiobiotin synthetase
MSPPRYVVSGTDTGIGKTVFAAALVGALNGVYWKPVQAGTEEETDSETVHRLSGARTLPEAWRLKMPASPHKAAAAEGTRIDPFALQLPHVDAPLVVEGAGGLMVPLTPEDLAIDLFARWNVPLVLCARTALGTINHTLLSIEALRARSVPLKGIAFVGPPDVENEHIICALSGARRLGRLDPVSPLNRETLTAAFAAGFRIEDFL